MKILHIFNEKKGTYFAKLLIGCINTSGFFNPLVHYFCVRDIKITQSLNYSNVFCDDDSGSIVYKYVDRYDYIFLHGLYTPDELYELPKKYLYKIIWRTWGGSSGLYSLVRRNIFIYFKDVINKKRKKSIVKHMPFVCGANIIDLFDTGQHKEHYYDFPYPISNENVILKDTNHNSRNKIFKILVGHSAFPSDKHDKVLNKLKCLLHQDVVIYVPLTYGSDEYRQSLIKKWKAVYGEKIVFITEQLSTFDYCKLVSSVNLFFLVGDKSYALGNIEIALRYNVNMVLSKRGLIRKGFAAEKIDYFVFEKINFQKGLSIFRQKLNRQINTSLVSDYKSDIQKLKIIFNMLEQKENNNEN